MSTIQAAEEWGDLSLYELWQVLVQGWRWIVAATVLGLLGAGGFLAVTAPEFEAVVLVQIRQVGQVGQVGQGIQIVQIEPTARAIERVKLPGFQAAVLKALGWESDSKAALYRASLKVAQGKSAELLELKVRAFSPEDARRAIGATVEHLAATHNELARPMTEMTSSMTTDRAEEIREAEALLMRLDRMTKEIPASNHREVLALLDMMDTQKVRLRKLRRQEVVAQDMSLQGLRAVTAPIEPPAVSEKPVFPRVGATLVLACLGGFLVGTVIVVATRRVRSPRALGVHAV